MKPRHRLFHLGRSESGRYNGGSQSRLCLLLLAALLAAPVFATPVSDPAITAALQPILEKHQLPAIAGAIVTSEGLAAQAVVGVRKAGAGVPATLDDRWHLGSCTKAMTATVVAHLVEQGKLGWDTTLAELFPDLAPRMNPATARATMRQLLSHHAGLAANLPWGEFARLGPLPAQRMRAVEMATTSAPPFEVGGAAHYANLGYVVAGAAIERLTSHVWEDVVREVVFAPLGMDSAGFGGTGTRGEIDQPWPHTAAGKPTPANEPDVDNPAVIGPAGRVHCTLADWARFIADHLRGARGESALLRPESYTVLHTPAGADEFALGWGAPQRGWGGGAVLNHAGCNTMNYADVWIAPKKDFAVLVVINQGDDDAGKAADEAASALIGLQGARARPPAHTPGGAQPAR